MSDRRLLDHATRHHRRSARRASPPPPRLFDPRHAAQRADALRLVPPLRRRDRRPGPGPRRGARRRHDAAGAGWPRCASRHAPRLRRRADRPIRPSPPSSEVALRHAHRAALRRSTSWPASRWTSQARATRRIDDTLRYCYHVAGVVGVMMALDHGRARRRRVLRPRLRPGPGVPADQHRARHRRGCRASAAVYLPAALAARGRHSAATTSR